MEFCGNEIEPELENLIQNSFEDRMNDLNEVLKNHESRLDQMDFIQNELKRIDTIVSERVSCKQSQYNKSALITTPLAFNFLYSIFATGSAMRADLFYWDRLLELMLLAIMCNPNISQKQKRIRES